MPWLSEAMKDVISCDKLCGTLAKLEAKENVEIIRNANVQEIKGTKKVETVLLDTGASLEVQGVFVAVGMIPQTEKLKDLVELDENGYVKAGEDGMTSKPGFFVAGAPLGQTNHGA